MKSRKEFVLFFLLVIALGMGIGWFLLKNYAEQKTAIVEKATTEALRLQNTFLQNLEVSTHGLQMAVDFMLKDQTLVDAFAKRDREELKHETVSFYENILKPQYGIEQFQFHTPPATSFLRVHDPKQHSDDLSAFRHIVVKVNQDKKASISGLELGKSGLGLRVVYPIWSGDQYIGSIELGKSLSSIIQYQVQKGPIEYAIALDLASYKAVASDVPKSELLLNSRWLFNEISSDFVNSVVQQMVQHPEGIQLIPQVDENLKDHMQLFFAPNGRQYFIWHFPLYDYSRKEIGQIYFIQGITAKLAIIKQSLIISLVIGIAALLLIAMVSFIQFNQLRQRFETALHRGAKELKEKEAAYQEIQQKFLDFEQLKRGYIASIRNKVVPSLLTCEGLLQHSSAAQSTMQQVQDELQILRLQLEDYRLLEELREGLLKWHNELFEIENIFHLLEQLMASSSRITPFVSLQITPAPSGIQLFMDKAALLSNLQSLIRHAMQHSVQGGMLELSARVIGNKLCIVLRYPTRETVALPAYSDSEFFQQLRQAPFPQEKTIPFYLCKALAVRYGGNFDMGQEMEHWQVKICLPMSSCDVLTAQA